MIALSYILLFSGATLVNAACSATIGSLADVADAVKCTAIDIHNFTVPAGESFQLNLQPGARVTMQGDILFEHKRWQGPLFVISGDNITFNGNGYTFDGEGPRYWDGKGQGGEFRKPAPMMKIKMSGTFTDLNIKNSPAAAFSVDTRGLTMSNLVVDNSAGDAPNALSAGLPAGHNTDGFDVSSNDVTIENCTIHNQDDCIAINKGSNIVFKNNNCYGGHGISIGSIDSHATVSNVLISGNTITQSDQALRIKTDASAVGSLVKNITYAGNTAYGIRKFGVLIDQSYPKTMGTPGDGVTLLDVNFESPTTLISVDSNAYMAAVNCGSYSCEGIWNWSYLNISGGRKGPINYLGIVGFDQ